VAALFSAALKYSSVSAKVRSPGRARSAVAKPVSGAVASPSTSPAIRWAISAVVNVILIGLIINAAAGSSIRNSSAKNGEWLPRRDRCLIKFPR